MYSLIHDLCIALLVAILASIWQKTKLIRRRLLFYIFNKQCYWSSTFKICPKGNDQIQLETLPNYLQEEYTDSFKWISNSYPKAFCVNRVLFYCTPLSDDPSGLFLETEELMIGFNDTRKIIDDLLDSIINKIEHNYKDITIYYAIKITFKESTNPYISNYLKSIKKMKISIFNCVYKVYNHSDEATITINKNNILITSKDHHLWRRESLKALALSNYNNGG